MRTQIISVVMSVEEVETVLVFILSVAVVFNNECKKRINIKTDFKGRINCANLICPSTNNWPFFFRILYLDV